MGKQLALGTGYQDHEDQLDMFDQLDAALADLHQVSTAPVAESDMFPHDTMGSIPCSWCVGPADLQELQRAALSNDTPRTVYPVGDSECLLCDGKTELPARLRRVEDYWWDWANRVMLKADRVGQARRKVEGPDPTPLYVEHGGYASH